MRRCLCLVLVVCFTFALVGCQRHYPKGLKNFEGQLKDVHKQEDKVKSEMDRIDLNQIKMLNQQEMTDKNKKDFNHLQNEINNELVPEAKAYKKAAHKLSAKNEKIKHLRNTYVKGADQKYKKIIDLKTFVDLCNQSIKANEDILDYTRLFEKKRSHMEANVVKGQRRGDKQDADHFVKKVENNNRELKNTAENFAEGGNDDKSREAIKNHIMPLIGKQIRDLNQTTIASNIINDARKDAIEMYYSLQNYYETRDETLHLSQKINRINRDDLPLKGKDLDQYDKPYEQELEKLKQSK